MTFTLTGHILQETKSFLDFLIVHKLCKYLSDLLQDIPIAKMNPV